MACPKILFLAAFILLLSFWVDLCHQADDEEDDGEETSNRRALLENSRVIPPSATIERHRRCCSLQTLNAGRRQKFVILVEAEFYIYMFSSFPLNSIVLLI